MTGYLKEGNIVLRALEPEDLEMLYAIENNRSLWSVTPYRTPYSRFALRQYLAAQPQDFFQCGELRLAIETADTHKPVGLIDLTGHSPTDARAEIGIAILEKERRKGHATAAMSALERYAGDILHLRMLYALVSKENNPACRKLFGAAGYRETAVLTAWNRTKDGYEDVSVFQKFLSESKTPRPSDCHPIP